MFKELLKTFTDAIDLNKPIDDLIHGVREVSAQEFMVYKGSQWIAPYDQGAQRLRECVYGTPMAVQALLESRFQNRGRLDIFNNGQCYFITKDYVSGWVAKFFLFELCEHEYKEANIGRCLNRYSCSKCNHTYTIDSGD